MELQIKKLVGGVYTPEDTLEVRLTGVEELHSLIFKVSNITGPEITHGGGASSDTFLYYNGTTDSTILSVMQKSTGVSTISVVANFITKDVWNLYTSTLEDYEARRLVGDEATWSEDFPTVPETIEISSTEITLEWQDAVFV